MQGIDLSSNDLTGWDLSGQNLTGADLARSILTNGNLTEADLSNTSLNVSTLDGTMLTGAILTGANLKKADFASAKNLSSAIFSSETVYNQWTRFPSDFSPDLAGLTFMESPVGDFDGDDLLEVSDADLLRERIRGTGPSWPPWRMFDVNGDADVNQRDLDTWVTELKRTWIGDADLNGRFDSLDVVGLLQAGKYEDSLVGNSTWPPAIGTRTASLIAST